MDDTGQSGIISDHQVRGKISPGGLMMTSSAQPVGVIALPKIRGGIVTRMTVSPTSGVIYSMNIETSEPGISFPEEIRFDLNAEINIQRIIIVGGSGMDSQ